MEMNVALLRSEGAFDSSKINQHIDIVKQMTVEGSYRGTVFKNDADSFSFILDVIDSGQENSAYVDLYELCEGHKLNERVEVAVGGYAIFHSSWGDAEYHVLLSLEQSIRFDSRSLNDSELVVITPFVTGSYEIEETATGARGNIEVRALPQGSEKLMENARRLLLKQPVPNMEIVDGHFVPDDVHIQGDQPVVVVASINTRVKGRRLNPAK